MSGCHRLDPLPTQQVYACLFPCLMRKGRLASNPNLNEFSQGHAGGKASRCGKEFRPSDHIHKNVLLNRVLGDLHVLLIEPLFSVTTCFTMMWSKSDIF